MRKLAYAAAGLAVVLAAGAGTAAAIGSNTHAGPQGDGTGITPVGWRVTPVGQQTTLGSLPTASALSPDGSELLVLNAGDHPIESLQVVDAASRKVTQTISYTTPAGLYAGVAFSPDGAHAYASGGGSEVIHTYAVANGHRGRPDRCDAERHKNDHGRHASQPHGGGPGGRHALRG